MLAIHKCKMPGWSWKCSAKWMVQTMIGLGNLCQWDQLPSSPKKSSDEFSQLNKSWKDQSVPWCLGCVRSKKLDKEPHFTSTKNHTPSSPLWNVSWNFVSGHKGGCSYARQPSIHDQWSRYFGSRVSSTDTHHSCDKVFIFFWEIVPNFSRVLG